MRRSTRFVAALLSLAPAAVVASLASHGCQRARSQLRADGCPATRPIEGEACAGDPNRFCTNYNGGGDSYGCQCVPRPDGRRTWTCVSAGGPLAPPDLPA